MSLLGTPSRPPHTMDEDNNNVLPDFKDIETKLGRKVPDSLLRSLAAGGKHLDKNKHEDSCSTSTTKPNFGAKSSRANSSTDLKRLESKMLFLKQEMAHLRAIDLKLMQQLMTINEGIESIRWVMEEKGGVASREGSLTGSLYSLSDSQDGTSSLQGSYNSLNDGNSDGLDGISVGSYLDTLDEDLPDRPSPTDLDDDLADKPVIDGGEGFSKPALKLRVESDEYYCFG